MFEHLREWTQTLPEWLQWFGPFLAGCVPFLESYFGAAFGVVIGIAPIIAIPAAILGNVISIVVIMTLGTQLQDRFRSRIQAEATDPAEGHARKRPTKYQRFNARFQKYGIPGVAVLGQTVLPSQFTCIALLALGAKRSTVLTWMTVSSALWGIVYGALATTGITFITST
ncbi:small multi-drug export protein [Corynebacterium sp. HS2168-gen11]|uniref:small multi-drug export protein n=1 Tax=Corynebacterium sp. HS2168-gen11 TaxID=2974027 RepID=UPI00216B5452|nr:small multi-drug export protein [Corynebacterium sp. HS2168-gen11]MCS4535780.1 small multi-drug export protein [Corynebacterium sp. HS2168-gen11]